MQLHPRDVAYRVLKPDKSHLGASLEEEFANVERLTGDNKYSCETCGKKVACAFRFMPAVLFLLLL
jgi:ubiquitin C-terminal hydrolase